MVYSLVYTRAMQSPSAVEALLDKLVFKKRHSADCQEKNGIGVWSLLSDSRKRCACPYWSCGVHERGSGFARKSTGEMSAERAKAVVRLRLESGNRAAKLEDAT